MAAGKHSSVEFSFTIDKADGGAPEDITAYITKFGDIVVDKGSVVSTPLGVDAEEYLLGVITKYEPIVIEGFYDDTATTGPDAILNIGKVVHAVTRSAVATLATSRTIAGEVWITNYKRGVTVGEYTSFSATIQFTGAVTEG